MIPRTFIFAFTMLALCSFAAESLWLSDLNSAFRKAQAEDKSVVLNFSGTDDFSKILHEEVFSTSEFLAFARANLVLVEINLSPRTETNRPTAIEAAEKLAAEFEIEKTPTSYVLSKDGIKLAKAGYVEGGADNYISLIKRIPGFRARPSLHEPVNSKGFTNLAQTTEPFVVLVPVIRSTELALRGITLGKQKTALINNQTFFEGEEARVKAGDKRVKVICKQILEDSVVIQVENEVSPRELFLKTRN
jgi:thioredoxin-related protein